MYNPTDSNSIFETLGMMNKANAYDVLVEQFKELKAEKIRLEIRNDVLTKALQEWQDWWYYDNGRKRDKAQAIYEAHQKTLNPTTNANVPAANPDDLKDLNTFNI